MTATKSWMGLFIMAIAAVALMAGNAQAAGVIDTAAMQRTSSGAVCTVTLQNSWGVPTVVQSGFLLGDGRFLVTDLGPLAQSSAALVVLGFDDGSMAVATQYGLVAPSMGLVMLRVEEAKVEAPKTDAAAPPPRRTNRPQRRRRRPPSRPKNPRPPRPPPTSRRRCATAFCWPHRCPRSNTGLRWPRWGGNGPTNWKRWRRGYRWVPPSRSLRPS